MAAQILAVPDGDDLAAMLEGELMLCLDLQKPSLADLIHGDRRHCFKLRGVVLVACVGNCNRARIGASPTYPHEVAVIARLRITMPGAGALASSARFTSQSG